MSVVARSFAKINIGLRIGARRDDGFHELRTLYQTVALYDTIRVETGRGVGIEIFSRDPKVPTDESNTCWRIAERVLKALKVRTKVRITIEKSLPVQGGLGAASSNAVVTMLAMEKALKRKLTPEDRLRVASEVGSDLPLFLIGGTVLGTGRGEQVYSMQDLPAIPCVIATPDIGVSTPAAFAAWDRAAAGLESRAFEDRDLENRDSENPEVEKRSIPAKKLTAAATSATINTFSQSLYGWQNGCFSPTGVPDKGWDRAETMLLDLVRAGIENDFESVVFPMYPAIREVKRVLERNGSGYASLSGSGSTVYGFFKEHGEAVRAARALNEREIPARATITLPRRRYWKELFQR